ncbi:tryptophan synthase subunit alpha [Fredinandcohnia quinoae]|uniref:Tryptophan synthase alpha chain n=1 Tax=Fredinandcohnia quinoae TaxID=2918902 RepID=A0AAW5E423_9BACI|nr:tryptophan synthase subunit alpha [Fredinandcohnia sp. SECRCQ15]MCH1624741.1 tryptophan synthase subunit alpha [Fredinandcohnia sp. SECRCQ15]
MKTTFEQRLPKKNKLFIPFIVAGDPHPNITVDLAIMLQEAGASVLELGIPYSDPLADGPVIQKAASRALKNEVTLENSIKLVSIMRKKGLKIPVIIFTYYNPVLQLGEDNFFALVQQNEVDGLLIPDLPFEENESLREKCQQNGVTFISLVAPTSTNRIAKIATNAQGFLYCVSALGVTGVRNSIHDHIYSFLEEAKKYSNVPVAVGFGISNSTQIEALKGYCDGVVIGSALVQKIEELIPKLMDEETKTTALLNFKNYVSSIISPINN